MRGGRTARGRGGRGRGEEHSMVTRSGAGKSNPKIDLGNSIGAELNGEDDGESPDGNEEGSQQEHETKENQNEALKEELRLLKEQLQRISQTMTNLGNQQAEQAQPGEKDTHQNDEEEYPALNKSATTVMTTTTVPPKLTSWKEKVASPKSPSGMPLKFIPPIIENGIQIVHIETHDVADLMKLWERAIVVYVVGGNVKMDVIRGFIRKHWSFVSMPTIHVHEDGFFILRFNTDEECEEILKGGPYFLNRAPMIVKKWDRNFDFKEEILRVIPVWIRLPSLPLHCWGEETLSRIVSAVGVPILADDCTAKQLKVSYTRVLVEVDITQEFVTEIKVRDNMGREFTQKAIPEWRPFYCRKCHKLGHECKEQPKQPNPSIEEEKNQRSQKLWVSSTIAKLMKGVTCIDDLRNSIEKEQGTLLGDNKQQSSKLCEEEENNNEEVNKGQLLPAPNIQQPVTEIQQCTATLNGDQDEKEHEEDEERGWTTVTAKKTARRITHKQPQSITLQEDSQQHIIVAHDHDEEQEARNKEHRDENPQIPSLQ